jgi:TRAP-type C4-dicarboxylate transport system permease large subunit
MGTLGTTFIAALPALLTPAIIVGGMTFGWFTPTEAAIAACTWALILGVFLYRSLSLKQFYKVTMDTIERLRAFCWLSLQRLCLVGS